jgi:hypothetical protein
MTVVSYVLLHVASFVMATVLVLTIEFICGYFRSHGRRRGARHG